MKLKPMADNVLLKQHEAAEATVGGIILATSTKENLMFSFEIIRNRGDEPEGNVAVLSSPYHLYRAKTM